MMKKKKRILILGIAFLILAAYQEFQRFEESKLPHSEEVGTIEDVAPSSDATQSADTEMESTLTINEARNKVYGPYDVERVVDGDTLIVNINEQSVKVRLLGVDTPESVAQGEREKDNCPEGKEASNFVKELLAGETVYLEYDVQREDKYGRMLAYVYHNGEQLEKTLLEKGYARVMTVAPNVLYADDYVELQRIARDAGAGFWESNLWG